MLTSWPAASSLSCRAPLHDRPYLQTMSQKEPFLPQVAFVRYYVTTAGENPSVDGSPTPACVHGWTCWLCAFAAHQGWWLCIQKPRLGSGNQGYGNCEDGGSRKGQVGLGKASFCLESGRRSRQQETQGPGPGRGREVSWLREKKDARNTVGSIQRCQPTFLSHTAGQEYSWTRHIAGQVHS